MIITWLEIGLSNALVATALAAIALVVTRRLRPQWAFAVWLLVLVKLLVPPMWNAPIGTFRAWLPASQASPTIDWLASDSPDWMRPGGAAESLPEKWKPPLAISEQWPLAGASGRALPKTSAAALLLTVWCLGATAWCCLAGWRIRKFVVGLRQAQRAPRVLQAETDALAKCLGLRRLPLVRLSRRRVPPLVWSLFGRPTILLPSALLRTLSPPQRTALLMHELVHLRRRDHLVKLVELAALSLYWWLPAAWWARRKLEQAAEHCCDEEVVTRLPNVAAAYAEALVATIDFLSEAPTPLPLGASGFSQFGHVSRRIEMILKPQARRPRALLSCLVLFVVSLGVLPLSVRTLWAEPADTAVETTAKTAKDTPSDANETTEDKASSQKEPPAGGRFVEGASGKDWEAGYDWHMNVDVTKEQVDEQLRKLVSKVINPLEVASKRREAAARQLKAQEAAYEADTVTLDQLLEAQRRLVEAETTYAREVYRLCPDKERQELLFSEANLLISREATDYARRTWKQVSAKSSKQNGEAAEEAQAREQYYQFKAQLRIMVDEYHRALDRAAKTSGSSQSSQAEITQIAGPVTSGGSPDTLDPPSDDEVFRAVMRERFKQSRSALDRTNVRIIKEKLAEYVDPPLVYPVLGRAQQHHARYKCSVYLETSDFVHPEHVIHVDRNHLHRLDDATTNSLPDDSSLGVVEQSAKFFIGADR